MSKLLSDISANQNEFQRFLRFAIVGAVGAAVDFGVLNIMILGFGWTEFFANLLSVSCAIISNFTWNRLWTFPESRERPLHTQFGQFVLVNLFGLGINQFVFLTSNALVFSRFIGSPLNYNLAKAAAIIVVLFWNFGANRLWTYRGI